MPTTGSTSSTSGQRLGKGAGPRRVVLGRVSGAHGIRGGVRVQLFGDQPEHLARAQRVWLGRGPDDPRAVAYEVASVDAARPGEVRMSLGGVTDREAAAELRGLLILGHPDLLTALPPGEYYWYDLVGCRVEGHDGTPIGTVSEVWETGAHDVLVVQGEDGRRRLLPAAQALLREVDVPGRRIVVEVIPGLLDPV